MHSNFVIQSTEESRLREFFATHGTKSVNIVQRSLHGYSGSAEFENFEKTIELLKLGGYGDTIEFNHPWYIPWPWIHKSKKEIELLNDAENVLNSDCIRHIFKYLNLAEQFYIAHQNGESFLWVGREMFSSQMEISRKCIGGYIGIINMLYIIQKFGTPTELSVSMDSFEPAFAGMHHSFTRFAVLFSITHHTKSKLARLNLMKFGSDMFTSEFQILMTELENRGIQIHLIWKLLHTRLMIPNWKSEYE